MSGKGSHEGTKTRRNGFLEKLLDLSADKAGGAEVEWMPLGRVIDLEKGKQLNKELLSETGIYPAYNGGVSYSGFTDSYNYEENTIIVSQGGASAGFVNFITSKFYANAHCYVVLPRTGIVANRYVYHFLKLNQEKLTDKQHGAGIPALRTSEILEIVIPIPCPWPYYRPFMFRLSASSRITNQPTTISATGCAARRRERRRKSQRLIGTMLFSKLTC